MLHDIGDRRYRCEYTPRDPEPARDYLLVYREGDVLLCDGCLPHVEMLARARAAGGVCRAEGVVRNECAYVDAAALSLRYLFSIGETGFFTPAEPAAFAFGEDAGFHFVPLRSVGEGHPTWLFFGCVTGAHLAAWYRNNVYCGACGERRVHKEDERALVCSRCGNIAYPNIAVAVIVAVTDGDRLLLTRYAGRPFKNYALIAGYVEIGETLEGTVHREVLEEVGLKVKNLRYFDNQPWGFSQSILFGFFAELDGSPEITLDRNELSEAVWLERDDIPVADTSISLTSTMIEAFRIGAM